MIIHDHYDALLTETVTSPTTAKEAAVSGIIDITEPGGSEAADLIITCPAADQALTISVLASAAKDGEFASVLSYETEAAKAFSLRERLPKYCPQYIKLQVTAGDTAPSSPVSATLRVAV